MLLLTDDEEQRAGAGLGGPCGAHAPVAAAAIRRGALEPKARRVVAARRAIEAYFAGALAAIADLPVKTAGTAFQREVWAALRAIPTGETTTYGRLASQLGRPKAMRAVGMANGANPISIIVPCHRVIGANASLTGYGGGHGAETLAAAA